MNGRRVLAVVLSLLSLSIGVALASGALPLAKGQTVYVPVYSNIFTAPKEVPEGLANILSIRNTDMSHAIRITAADYYDTSGKVLKSHYKKPVTLGPMESTHIYLSERDQAGGVGANFVVTWEADKEVNPPLIECVNAGNQGRAFVTRGQVIRETH